ncbi:prostatic acid phosphatase [Nilaparvata lugens]|uniref:prostatic acid phosphatase n=1 Tax=Nilaparvata lugens TaxID=108931 RepID=UPI00193CD173|nr:prostatic acid phosphatase [Nilaparvata lugens]XP_039289396.1 prostatic acid phosphatase [Nilaparvata lugens]XP_039289397.1 prostatic acid phosphatase [Nilaparvata lugens]
MEEEGKVPHSKLYIFLNFFTITASIVIIYIICVHDSADALKSYEAPRSLEFAIIAFRHGSRSPVSTFPTDTSQWPDGRKVLTSRGKSQMLKRGQALRERYGNFFNNTFRQQDFLIRTTNRSRTRMSLEILLSGMFPPDLSQPGNWQPVNILTDNFDKTHIAADEKICPKYSSEQFTDLQFDAYLQREKDFVKFLYDRTGLVIHDPHDMLIIWDVLKCSAEEGLSLPDWATKNVTNKLNNEIENIMHSVVASSPRATTFIEGLLIHYFNNWLTQRSSGNASEKFLIHSGHDYTLLSLLTVVGFKHVDIIPPATVLIFEVHKAHRSHEVKLVLYNSTSFENSEEIAEPISVDMPRCSGKCTLEKFQSILKEYEIDENAWIERCFEQ